jgi:UDP-N-acetylmuramoylalanine--D-glutamate ligase
VLLNIAPDHLDRHGDMQSYRAAKLRVFAQQGGDDVAVVPAGALGAELPGLATRLTFGADSAADVRFDGSWLWWREERLMEAAAIRLRGPHNLENAMAAAAAALVGAVPVDGVREALATFAGVAHRLEEVTNVGGVLFVNDSKATNVASTLVALRSFAPRSVHLILGGRGKGEDYALLREEVVARARAVYLIGEDGPALGAALQEAAAGAGLALTACGTLERALAAARAVAVPGEVVLLSPACTSFDQFEDFEARGEAFTRLVLV